MGNISEQQRWKFLPLWNLNFSWGWQAINKINPWNIWWQQMWWRKIKLEIRWWRSKSQRHWWKNISGRESTVCERWGRRVPGRVYPVPPFQGSQREAWWGRGSRSWGWWDPRGWGQFFWVSVNMLGWEDIWKYRATWVAWFLLFLIKITLTIALRIDYRKEMGPQGYWSGICWNGSRETCS